MSLLPYFLSFENTTFNFFPSLSFFLPPLLYVCPFFLNYLICVFLISFCHFNFPFSHIDLINFPSHNLSHLSTLSYEIISLPSSCLFPILVIFLSTFSTNTFRKGQLDTPLLDVPIFYYATLSLGSTWLHTQVLLVFFVGGGTVVLSPPLQS